MTMAAGPLPKTGWKDGPLPVWKPVGPTSNSIALAWSKNCGTVVGHAGNLDPMAEGVLVLLIGPEANRAQAQYKAAGKEYRFDLLFGFETDSYDLLGEVTRKAPYSLGRISPKRLGRIIRRLPGRMRQTYPPFSYPKVGGRSLLWWARHGRMKEIRPPTRAVTILRAELRTIRSIGKASLRRRIVSEIRKVRGDFRQERILGKWKAALAAHPNARFAIARIHIQCTAGTYIRGLSCLFGRRFGLPALALRIRRTRSGEFRLSDCLKPEESEGTEKGG